ncbi:MAG: hypothetical protein K2P81_08765 [Bacteriovoracaceae bacterium]|nr:hypothetical protein [Bacteriovoracaceae bacterium]
MKSKNSLFLLLFFLSSNAFAVEVGAFGNIRAAMTTIDKNVTYNDISNRPTVSDVSQVGVNFSQSLSDQSHGLVQVLYNNTSGANLDLFQIKHQQEEYTFRIGKQRIPLLMVSEHVQVAALLPWVSAPTEVYGKLPFNSFNGASIERRFGPFSALLFAGDSTETLVTPATGASYNVKTRGFHGARLELNTDISRLYMGYAGFDGIVDVAIQTPISSGSSSNVIYKFRDKLNNYQLMTVGGKLNWGKYFLMSEYLDAKSNGFLVKRERSGYVSVGTVIKDK